MHTEATIEAELYMQLRLAGYDAELNMYTPAGRPDVTVFGRDRTEVIAFVEVKTYPQHPEARQLFRYRQCNVPVLRHWRFGKEDQIIEELMKLKRAVPISSIAATVPLPRRLKRRALLKDKYTELNIRSSK